MKKLLVSLLLATIAVAIFTAPTLADGQGRGYNALQNADPTGLSNGIDTADNHADVHSGLIQGGF